MSLLDPKGPEELGRHFDAVMGLSHARENGAHVICCNDSVESVVLGTEEQAKTRLESLARYDFDHRSKWNFGWTPDNVDVPYKEYRHRHYWHIHTVPCTEFEGSI